MILTTTNSIEGKTIRDYRGIIFGEVIAGINAIKDFGASVRNVFGGRSAGYEDEMARARAEALAELEQRAADVGANAVVGIDIDYDIIGGMLMVSASGTAVWVE